MRHLALLCFALAACGTTVRAIPINPSPHAMSPRPPQTVEMFTSGPPHDRHFVDVAFLEAEQDSAYSVDQMPDFLTALRKRAAAMGCDGVVLGSPTNKVTTELDGEHPANLSGIVATCIVFTDAPDSTVAAKP